MKIVDVVGARPQFIKLAPVLKAIQKHNREAGGTPIREVLVHTGQHYDYEMSQVFFDELGLKVPDHHLGVGSGTHAYQTGEMLKRVEEVLLAERPDAVLVYGDTNSTLAGALAAAKLHIPVAHVEAGLRSYNRRMPEEHNRVLADHCSDILFCPTATAVENLRREGFGNVLNGGRLLPRGGPGELFLSGHAFRSGPLAVNTGDVMYDAALLYASLSEKKSKALEELGLSPRAYALATLHRAENTDRVDRLAGIMEGLERIAAEGLPVVLPAHPRTRKALKEAGIGVRGVKVIEPVSYLDMLALEKGARVILTDSGGVQKEAFFFMVPCVTLREETEWVETVEAGWNVLAGWEPESIAQRTLGVNRGLDVESPYGDGFAAERIVACFSTG